MLKNRIIPCLDVKNGRVVKGINFVDLKDAGDPVEQAKIYSDGGADEICFLDITASNENRETIDDVNKKTKPSKYTSNLLFNIFIFFKQQPASGNIPSLMRSGKCIRNRYGTRYDY